MSTPPESPSSPLQNRLVDPERFRRLIARIDALNGEDPQQDVADGSSYPRELLYAKRLTAWVLRLVPDASEALQIAARAQHVQRWTIPRERYPKTRQGYLRWREMLKTFHIETTARAMREAGYDEEMIGQVGRLMSKRRLTDDPQTQALEDALCLLFLETQFADLRRKTAAETMAGVVRKTWGKMSPQGRAEVLKLPLSEDDRKFLEAALANEP